MNDFADAIAISRLAIDSTNKGPGVELKVLAKVIVRIRAILVTIKVHMDNF